MDAIPEGRVAGLPEVEAVGLPDDAVILDVRDGADFAAGHAPGAVSMPLARLGAPGGLDALAGLVAALPAGSPLVVSCGGGSKQTRAVAFLRAHGVPAVVLRGGMRGWSAAGRPLVAGDPDPSG